MLIVIDKITHIEKSHIQEYGKTRYFLDVHLISGKMVGFEYTKKESRDSIYNKFASKLVPAPVLEIAR